MTDCPFVLIHTPSGLPVRYALNSQSLSCLSLSPLSLAILKVQLSCTTGTQMHSHLLLLTEWLCLCVSHTPRGLNLLDRHTGHCITSHVRQVKSNVSAAKQQMIHLHSGVQVASVTSLSPSLLFSSSFFSSSHTTLSSFASSSSSSSLSPHSIAPCCSD